MLHSLLLTFFDLLYNQLAWSYDMVSWLVSWGQWRACQRTALPYLRGRQVLEVAHGTGDMLLDLTALGFRAVGLDLSARMGRVARRKLRRLGLAEAVPLVRARVQALPFAPESFPSLLATFPTEFILDPAALAEFARVLQAGGVLVAVPVFVVTGRSLPDRLARALFALTGESDAGWLRDFEARCARAGLRARLERVPLPRSVVSVIVAEKI